LHRIQTVWNAIVLQYEQAKLGHRRDRIFSNMLGVVALDVDGDTPFAGHSNGLSKLMRVQTHLGKGTDAEAQQGEHDRHRDHVLVLQQRCKDSEAAETDKYALAGIHPVRRFDIEALVPFPP
jgi:hypothetical protein